MDTFEVQWIADAINNGYYQLRKVADNDKSIMRYIMTNYGIKVTSKFIKDLLNELPKLKELQKGAAKGARPFKIDYGIWADKLQEVTETFDDYTSTVNIEDLI